jgi:uncharacterized protein YkwD
MRAWKVRLPVIVLGSLLLLISARASELGADDRFRLSTEEQKLLELTNAERKKEKLPPLAPSPLLFKVARAHSANMARQEKMDHYLDGKKPKERVTESGYDWRYTGENLAFGDADVELEEIMQGWMKSEKHRDNIVSPRYTEIGLGLAKGEDGLIYYTQVFGTPRKKD